MLVAPGRGVGWFSLGWKVYLQSTAQGPGVLVLLRSGLVSIGL